MRRVHEARAVSDESYGSMPPEGAAARRRRSDRVDWLKVAKVVGYSAPVWAPMLWQVVGYGLQAHTQWLSFEKLPTRIEQLEQTAKEHTDFEKRLLSLERYRCILGYDPGGRLGQATILPRDRRAECRVLPNEMAAAPAAPAPTR